MDRAKPTDEGSDSPSRDKGILQVGGLLCSQLGISSAPKKISWQNRITEGKGSRFLPSDECEVRLSLLILPERMREMLDPEDWEPLLASSLVYHRKLRTAQFRHLVKRWGLGVILPINILTALLIILFLPRMEIGILGIFLATLVLVLIVGNTVSAPYVKRIRLQADQIAADIVGRTFFLQVLRKIDSVGQEDLIKLERRRGIRARFTGRPTITERINNLSR